MKLRKLIAIVRAPKQKVIRSLKIYQNWGVRFSVKIGERLGKRGDSVKLEGTSGFLGCVFNKGGLYRGDSRYNVVKSQVVSTV